MNPWTKDTNHIYHKYHNLIIFYSPSKCLRFISNSILNLVWKRPSFHRSLVPYRRTSHLGFHCYPSCYRTYPLLVASFPCRFWFRRSCTQSTCIPHRRSILLYCEMEPSGTWSKHEHLKLYQRDSSCKGVQQHIPFVYFYRSTYHRCHSCRVCISSILRLSKQDGISRCCNRD